MKKVILLFIFLISVVGYGQDSKLYRANKDFDQYDYVDAQRIYQKVVDKGYESADLFKKLADSYYLNAKYEIK